MIEIVQERDGWVLALEDYQAATDTYTYSMAPPKWRISYQIARNGVPGGHSAEVEACAEQMQRALVDAILEDPVVKQELHRRLERAEREGFLGAYAEHRNREKYRFKYVGGAEWNER